MTTPKVRGTDDTHDAHEAMRTTGHENDLVDRLVLEHADEQRTPLREQLLQLHRATANVDCRFHMRRERITSCDEWMRRGTVVATRRCNVARRVATWRAVLQRGEPPTRLRRGSAPPAALQGRPLPTHAWPTLTAHVARECGKWGREVGKPDTP
jgi:hypothetical protein